MTFTRFVFQSLIFIFPSLPNVKPLQWILGLLSPAYSPAKVTRGLTMESGV
jgi:hypothetical protein